jgi:NAD(P)-dependent dehydrogenase (short-subunit alcohol dehydrogenase family)
MPTPNKNKKHGAVIVTGGSRGIGAAVSRLVSSHGYPVAVNFVKDEAAAAAVVRDIVSAGGHAIAVQGNVGREEDILRLFKTAERELGPIEGLVNNAAVTGGFARVQDVTASALAEVFTINVRRLYREYFFDCGPYRRGWRMGSLLGVERRYQQFHGWTGARGGNRRHPRQCCSSRADRN